MPSKPEAGDERPPICPACGVTMFIVNEDGTTPYVCLECGFSDETTRTFVRPRSQGRNQLT